ncbi:hypothetical protein [Microbacterium sp. CIAB417]|uniref:hypothetical protein n=1 Tax=Microbacterium sp. CIAB417 TaxID=2860287 RepID=UPI001FAB7BB6|nr:hypothetical protein [Microbacterium sp. CIAB417]
MTDPQLPDGFRPAPPPAPPVPPAGAEAGQQTAPSGRPDGGTPSPEGPARDVAPFGAPAPGAQPGGDAFSAPAFPAPTPPYQAPGGAYQVPVGGYQTAAGAYSVAITPETPSRTTGVIALVLSLAAAILMPVIGGFASWEVGRRIPSALENVTTADLESLAFLSPARDQVLWAELSFWAGTVLGIAAFILGVIAIVKRRGRGMGIAALIVAVIGPVIFFTVAFFALSIGAAVGSAALLGAV